MTITEKLYLLTIVVKVSQDGLTSFLLSQEQLEIRMRMIQNSRDIIITGL